MDPKSGGEYAASREALRSELEESLPGGQGQMALVAAVSSLC